MRKVRTKAVTKNGNQAARRPEPQQPFGIATEIDLERVIYDPEYRRWARDHLNRLLGAGCPQGEERCLA